MARGSFPVLTDQTRFSVSQLFKYEPETGHLTSIIQKSGPRKIGSVVGYLRKDGYIGLSIQAKEYLAHRIIWLLIYGEWPVAEIDHINGIKSDNRLENLRDVSISVNNQNIQRAKAGNSLGVLGVRKSKNKYIASVRRNKKAIHLGTYNTKEEASKSYQGFREAERVDPGPQAQLHSERAQTRDTEMAS